MAQASEDPDVRRCWRYVRYLETRIGRMTAEDAGMREALTIARVREHRYREQLAAVRRLLRFSWRKGK